MPQVWQPPRGGRRRWRQGGSPREEGDGGDISEKKDDDEPKNDDEAKVDERKNNSEKQRRVKSSLDVAVAEATVVKSTMSTVTSSAKSVLESMDADPEWQR